MSRELNRPQDTAFPIPIQRQGEFLFTAHNDFVAAHDDYNESSNKALQLLRSIISEKQREELATKATITVVGKRGIYILSPYNSTEIRDKISGRFVAYACLQLSIPAPLYDRLVAEYLILNNLEDFYWRTANIFHRRGSSLGIATLFFIGLDIALFVNLLMEELLRMR